MGWQSRGRAAKLKSTLQTASLVTHCSEEWLWGINDFDRSSRREGELPKSSECYNNPNVAENRDCQIELLWELTI